MIADLIIAIFVYLISLIIKAIKASVADSKAKKSVNTKGKHYTPGRIVYRDTDANDQGRIKARKALGKQYIPLTSQNASENPTRKSAMKPIVGAKVPGGARLVYCPNCGCGNLISQYETSDHYYCHSCAGNLFEAIQ